MFSIIRPQMFSLVHHAPADDCVGSHLAHFDGPLRNASVSSSMPAPSADSNSNRCRTIRRPPQRNSIAETTADPPITQPAPRRGATASPNAIGKIARMIECPGIFRLKSANAVTAAARNPANSSVVRSNDSNCSRVLVIDENRLCRRTPSY